jgi:formylglycine-generating enzyme required for sulfatase activity
MLRKLEELQAGEQKDKRTGAVENQLSESLKLSESSTPSENRPRKSGIHDMVFVEGGTFTMGDDTDEDDDNCEHKATVGSFSIGKYEVTQADWREVMGEDPFYIKNKGCDECPVESLHWDDIQDFLKALNKKYPRKNYRLPSEAEWEYAARGGNKSAGYKYAGSNDCKKVSWFSDNSGSKTHPVGELAANELGLYDMSGNVMEQCRDFWTPYPCDKETKPDKWIHVARGGAFVHYHTGCFVASRRAYNTDPWSYIGFRLAR